MRGCMKGKSPEKDAEKTDVRGDKGAVLLELTTPLRAQAARGRILGAILASIFRCF